tara:strand:- start:33 stop:653 length:621 start_codon:yes stop_codon:yes gene_type:complete
MKIKICGLNPTRDVQLCIDLKVDFLGFVFYEKSPRNLDLNDVKKLKNYKKQKSLFVAVTVNPSDEFIQNIVLKNFDYIQLHGSETIERVKEIKSMGLKVIKSIKVKDETDINNYKKYKEADLILFDTPGMEQSIKFPENLITKLPRGERFAVAGSVSEHNIDNMIKLGVNFFDLSSSLESKLGQKDHLKIRGFMNKIYKINEHRKN